MCVDLLLDTKEELEAYLEGELNEFEVVSSKDTCRTRDGSLL